MPKEREYEKTIPALHRKKFLDIALYFYVTGQMDTLPTINIKQAIVLFLKRHKICEDGWNLENAQQTYSKIRNEIINFKDGI